MNDIRGLYPGHLIAAGGVMDLNLPDQTVLIRDSPGNSACSCGGALLILFRTDKK